MKNQAKEYFLACGFMIVSMAVFYILGFAALGMAFATGALCFIMLRESFARAVLASLIVYLADCMLRLTFISAGGTMIYIAALFMCLAIKQRGGLLGVCAAGILGNLLAFAIFLSATQILNIEGFRISDIKLMISQMGDNIKNMMMQPEMKEMLVGVSDSDISQMVDFSLMGVVPSTILMVLATNVYISIAVLKKMMSVAKSNVCDAICKFSEIKADKTTVVMMIVSLIVYVTAKNQVVGAAAFAMWICFAAFFCVCALSIGVFYINRKGNFSSKGKKAILYLVLFMGMLFLMPTAVIIGVVDAFADFRKLKGVK